MAEKIESDRRNILLETQSMVAKEEKLLAPLITDAELALKKINLTSNDPIKLFAYHFAKLDIITQLDLRIQALEFLCPKNQIKRGNWDF